MVGRGAPSEIATEMIGRPGVVAAVAGAATGWMGRRATGATICVGSCGDRGTVAVPLLLAHCAGLAAGMIACTPGLDCTNDSSRTARG